MRTADNSLSVFVHDEQVNDASPEQQGGELMTEQSFRVSHESVFGWKQSQLPASQSVMGC